MNMYTYYVIAAIVALWLYRLAAYHFGANANENEKAKSSEARSRRRGSRY
ncbi:hypothetical protein [Chitinophaga sp. YIM B06452]